MKQILLLFLVVILFQVVSLANEYSEAYFVEGNAASDALELYDYTSSLSYLAPCIQKYSDVKQGYYNCICACNDRAAISVIKKCDGILSRHSEWGNRPVNVQFGNSTRVINPVAYRTIINAVRPCLNK